MSFRKLLVNAAHLQCEDPRDKVYGLLGIARKIYGDIDFDFDYGRPASEVLWYDLGRTKLGPYDASAQARLISQGREMGVTGREEIANESHVLQRCRQIWGALDPGP
jgi:hypothetical protein